MSNLDSFEFIRKRRILLSSLDANYFQVRFRKLTRRQKKQQLTLINWPLKAFKIVFIEKRFNINALGLCLKPTSLTKIQLALFESWNLGFD